MKSVCLGQFYASWLGRILGREYILQSALYINNISSYGLDKCATVATGQRSQQLALLPYQLPAYSVKNVNHQYWQFNQHSSYNQWDRFS